MKTEIELKLGVAPDAAADLAQLPWLRRLSGDHIERRTLHSVYFDTRKLKLHERGMTLRVRRAERQRVQTIKSVRGGAGPFERAEWEHEISGDAPDLELAADTPLASLASKRKFRRKLKPIFETVIERTTFPIRAERAQLELALDRGHIRARGMRLREPISEIEIELKDGDPDELSRLAKRLARSLAVVYAPRSKSDRGYALSCRKPHAPVRGAQIHLDTHATAGAALQTIARSCLDHALANEGAVRRGDPEGVHQMRVGLRRLRAAISLFKELLRGPETEALKRELKWLTEQLSRARDLDVLIAERVHPLRDVALIGADAGVLEQDLDVERQAGIRNARAAVDSERFRALGLRVALWLTHGAWLRSGAANSKRRRRMPVREFAAAALTRRMKKILKKARKVERLDPRARHQLRIAVKKLRYACEFFAALFAGHKRDADRRRLCKILKELQGFLGTLNDIEVHKQLARRLARSGPRSRAQPRKALAMGFITGREDKQAAFCFQGIERATRRLRQLPAYWA